MSIRNAEGSAFLIALGKRRVDREDDYAAYIAGATPILVEHGADLVGRYSVGDLLHGDADYQTVFVAKFPSVQAIKAVFSDQAYQPLLPFRERAFSELQLLIARED